MSERYNPIPLPDRESAGIDINTPYCGTMDFDSFSYITIMDTVTEDLQNGIVTSDIPVIHSPEEILKSAPHSDFAQGIGLNGFDPIADMGDLAHRPTEIRAEIISNTIGKYTEPALAEYVNSVKTGSPSEVATIVQALNDQNDSFEAHVEEEIAQNRETYDRIAARYREADMRAQDECAHLGITDPTEIMKYRAAYRLASAGTVHLESDFDGTISDTRDAARDYLEKFVPGSSVLEELLRGDTGTEDRDRFIPAFAAASRLPLRDVPELFRDAGTHVKLREGFAEFLQYAKDANISFSVLSANFAPIVEGALGAIPEANGVRILGVTPDDTRATRKGAVLNLRALHHPDTALEYAGDGSSDAPTIDSMDMVAIYWAYAGSSFEKQLQEAGACYLTYTDFNQITEQQRDLMQKRDMIAAANQTLS